MPEQERVDENTMLVTVGDLNKMAGKLKKAARKLDCEASELGKNTPNSGAEQSNLIEHASIFRVIAKVLKGEEAE